MIDLKRILRRTGVLSLSILLFFVIRSRVFADMAWEPEPDPAEVATRRLILILLACIIAPIWLFAKGRMLKRYDGSGWWIIVPIYGRYLEYKYYWDTKYFMINLCILGFSFIMIFSIFSGNTISISPGIIVIPLMLLICLVNTVLMRMKTMEAFGKNKFLGLLELLGLGLVLDWVCALSCIREEAEKKS